MTTRNHHLVTVLTAALLGTHASACARGDILLGAFGGDASGGRGAIVTGGAGASGAPTAGDSAGAPSQGVAAAGSFSGAAGSAGTAGMNAEAGMAAPAGSGAAGAPSIPKPGTRPSAGCGKDPVLPPETTITPVPGARGTYIPDLPMGYDKTRAYPLIIALRGANVTAESFRGDLNLPAVTGSAAILVHPNPLNDATTWDVQRDLPLVDALVGKLGYSYCIDLSRVFAIGQGTGALFVTMLGCVRGDAFRAIAPLSAAPPPGGCLGEPAVWLLQGNADPMMLGIGLGNRDFWAGKNSCDVTMGSPVPPAGCEEYAGCDAGYPVQYCQYDGNTDLPSFAASGVWDFFKAF
jgi:polyhydroxybutyrate depolymerase